ncbi:MAG: hypothetical protein H0U95_12300 [Bacteroidetes bacterium]|nr:hypothetical protein [Bacteroidota bacterium]
MIIFDRIPSSPFIPIYASYLSFVPALIQFVLGIMSVQGIIYVLTKKKGGWSLLFLGSLSLVLSSFIPAHGLPYGLSFRNWYDLIFLLVPVLLLSKRSGTRCTISSLNFICVLVAVFMVLVTCFFSFDIFRSLS